MTTTAFNKKEKIMLTLPSLPALPTIQVKDVVLLVVIVNSLIYIPRLIAALYRKWQGTKTRTRAPTPDLEKKGRAKDTRKPGGMVLTTLPKFPLFSLSFFFFFFNYKRFLTLSVLA